MFENEDIKNANAHPAACQCQSNKVLIIPSRQTSLVVAAFLLMAFLLFMSGYFLGQKQIIANFADRIEHESFSDQIYSSMCSMVNTDQDDHDIESTDAADQSQTTDNAQEQTEASGPAQLEKTKKESQVQPSQNSPQALEESESESAASTTEYYAQLAGFSTQRSAQQLAQRLIKKEIPVLVKKRQSRSAKGKFVYWYQVITEKYNDRAELEEVVAKLVQDEKLKDVNIITC